jgi:hypothetical protein
MGHQAAINLFAVRTHSGPFNVGANQNSQKRGPIRIQKRGPSSLIANKMFSTGQTINPRPLFQTSSQQ